MASYYVYVIGFIAQILFSARLIVQWVKSEKAGESLSPTLFWQLSILASWMLFLYGVLRDDFAIILGQVVSYFVYIRNIQIKGNWKMLPRLLRLIYLVTPVIALFYMALDSDNQINLLFGNRDIPYLLLLWGTAGQIIFTLRFVYQWIYSEKEHKSVLPMGFWLISLIGSVMILSYAVYRRDPVLFIGQGFGAIIYLRNIFLLHKKNMVIVDEIE